MQFSLFIYYHFLESARILLANEGLHKLFGNTRLKLVDVSPNVTEVAGHSPLPLLFYPFGSRLAVTKISFCASEATGKQVPEIRKL